MQDQNIKFRCTLFQKKLLKAAAKKSGISLSEFCRKAALEKKIVERLTDDEIAAYKNLTKFHNNFKWIGNMFRKSDPNLSTAVYNLADEIKAHLQKFQK